MTPKSAILGRGKPVDTSLGPARRPAGNRPVIWRPPEDFDENYWKNIRRAPWGSPTSIASRPAGLHQTPTDLFFDQPAPVRLSSGVRAHSLHCDPMFKGQRLGSIQYVRAHAADMKFARFIHRLEIPRRLLRLEKSRGRRLICEDRFTKILQEV